METFLDQNSAKAAKIYPFLMKYALGCNAWKIGLLFIQTGHTGVVALWSKYRNFKKFPIWSHC